MKSTLFFIVFLISNVYAQHTNEIKYYNYGKNGIEFIVEEMDGTKIIVSTFNSKPKIKDEVALNVLKYFDDKSPKDSEILKIETKEAVVEGVFHIVYKKNLISIEFHYQSVIWFKKNLKEIYVEPTIFSSKNSLVKK